jgi:hypothetical protein
MGLPQTFGTHWYTPDATFLEERTREQILRRCQDKFVIQSLTILWSLVIH